MSVITSIENSITQLGPGEFQKFCDTFLSQQNQYGKILGLGMKTGTLKTTIGNPDTYFRKGNGKYVFVAYTCQQTGKIYEKLREDIIKCLDPEKTKLPIEAIDEIICCHTSSNLSAGDDFQLHKLCDDKGIKLSIMGVDEIAQQIYKFHPKIAKDFFGISLDTNQIMQIEDFVDLYDCNEMAAPLNTVFQGRKEELASVIDLLKNNKVVIIHGPAGTGKTRLVLEAIRRFSEDTGYILLCVKNNNQPLYEDLITKTEEKGNYLFFIDDANELAGISEILSYASTKRGGSSVRIIMTVRDYAREEVIINVNKVTSPGLMQLDPFTDEDIRAFLDINMEITNPLYVDQIVRIAEGNPRIAYMAGRIAKEKQTLSSINDASQVYDQYYSGIVNNKIGNDRNLCLTAGILSLLNAVFLNKLDRLSDLFRAGDLSEDAFKKCIYYLAQMEVVEIHKDLVAAISDQCLSNYMLYYVFFKKKELPFSEVLYIGFKHFKEGVVRSINTLLHIFSAKDLCQYISEEVGKVWDRLEKERDPCFESFVVTFHMFRPEEAFLIADNKIDQLKQEKIENKYIDFNKQTIRSDDEIVELLSGYGNTNYLITAIELLIKYVSKSDEKAVIGFQFVKNSYCIDQDSYRYRFYTMRTVGETLSKYDGDNLYVCKFILAVVREYLQFEFRPTEVGRGNTFRLYHIELHDDPGVAEYREICWNIIIKLSKNPELKNEIESFLKHYAVSIRGAADKNLVEEDKVHIESIFKQLSLSDIKRSLIIRDLYYGWKKIGVEFNEDNAIFESKEWNLLTSLNDEFIYSGLDYEAYEKQRLQKLKQIAENTDQDEMEDLVNSAIEIIRESRFQENRDSEYAVTHSIEIIAMELQSNEKKLLALFNAILAKSDDININPRGMLSALFGVMSSEELYEKINEKEYAASNLWNYLFFDAVPEENVDEKVYKHLIEFLPSESDKAINSSAYRSLRFLDKFKTFDKNIYVTASQIIFNKIEYNKFIVEMYFALLFYEQCYSPDELIDLFNSDVSLLQDIYFFMLKHGKLEDLQGIFLKRFLSEGEEWIDRYADYLAGMINEGNDHDLYRYKALWETDEYIHYFDCIFNKISEKDGYIYNWRLAEEFKVMLARDSTNGIVAERQKTWLLHVIEDHAFDENVVTLFNALLESSQELRKMCLLEFLRINDNFEMFEKIPLDPSHWGGEVSKIIPQLTNRVSYLESLLDELKGAKYLKHSKRIKERIEFWKAQIKEEELQMICLKLYQ